MAGNNISALGDFKKAVDAAKHEHFAGKNGVKVADEAAFTAMQAHVSRLYSGVTEVHSFEDENGSVFDCIPVNQQPALKGAAPAQPPNLPATEKSTGPAGTPTGDRRPIEITGAFEIARKDKYGNQMSCPAGHIPMRRITLEELTRFETMRHFFQKSPAGGGHPPKASSSPAATAPQGIAPGVSATHRWAHAYQNVNNLGGHSYINLWDPPIGANQIFSLSQHWYVGGSGAALQTAECGWQVYPVKYGNSLPVFFIYWTADDYNHTGCYNLDCSAFVQTNHSVTIGGTISPSSVYGGAQYEIQLSFYLYQGNWWLYWGAGLRATRLDTIQRPFIREGRWLRTPQKSTTVVKLLAQPAFPEWEAGTLPTRAGPRPVIRGT